MFAKNYAKYYELFNEDKPYNTLLLIVEPLRKEMSVLKVDYVPYWQIVVVVAVVAVEMMSGEWYLLEYSINQTSKHEL